MVGRGSRRASVFQTRATKFLNSPLPALRRASSEQETFPIPQGLLKKWDGRLARLFCSAVDGRDARPTKFLNSPLTGLSQGLDKSAKKLFL